MAKKILGWVLLTTGLLIIFSGLYHSYQIFTAKAQVPELFKMGQAKIEETAPSAKNESQKTLTPAESQEEIKKMISEQMKEMVPAEFLSKILNLISWSIFVGILFLGGGKLSSIGINLLRE